MGNCATQPGAIQNLGTTGNGGTAGSSGQELPTERRKTSLTSHQSPLEQTNVSEVTPNAAATGASGSISGYNPIMGPPPPDGQATQTTPSAQQSITASSPVDHGQSVNTTNAAGMSSASQSQPTQHATSTGPTYIPAAAVATTTGVVTNPGSNTLQTRTPALPAIEKRDGPGLRRFRKAIRATITEHRLWSVLWHELDRLTNEVKDGMLENVRNDKKKDLGPHIRSRRTAGPVSGRTALPALGTITNRGDLSDYEEETSTIRAESNPENKSAQASQQASESETKAAASTVSATADATTNTTATASKSTPLSAPAPAPAPTTSAVPGSGTRSLKAEKDQKRRLSLQRRRQELGVSELDRYDETGGVPIDYIYNVTLNQHAVRTSAPKFPISGRHNDFQIADLPILTDDTPLTPEWIAKMVAEFKLERILCYQNVFQIAKRALQTLINQPNVVDVYIPANDSLAVIGDIHGQLDDLLMVFREAGYPGHGPRMLFNGDVVDRGAYSCECIFTLLACRALRPDRFYINRGNHECADMNSQDGFQRECEAKYDNAMYTYINQVFASFPIAHMVQILKEPDEPAKPADSHETPDVRAASPISPEGNSLPEAVAAAAAGSPPPSAPNVITTTDGTGKVVVVDPSQVTQRVFVVHAGLTFRDVSIDQINKENRYLVVFKMHSILQDMLWSDPFDGYGHRASRRGAGWQFGADVANRFLIRNNVQLIIRSHECEDNGFALWFDNRLYTIFSASSYCGETDNFGAFCILSHAPTPQIRVYLAKRQVLKYDERQSRWQKSLFSKLLVRIVAHIDQIELALGKASVARGTPGIVSRVVWSNVLKDCLKIDVPFLGFATKLGLSKRFARVPAGVVNVEEWCKRFKPKYHDTSVADEFDLRRQLSYLLFDPHSPFIEGLEALFAHFDANSDGYITYDEFKLGVHGLMDYIGKTYSDEDMSKLLDLVDQNKDGEIDYHEFFAAFAYAEFDLESIEEDEIPTTVSNQGILAAASK